MTDILIFAGGLIVGVAITGLSVLFAIYKAMMKHIKESELK